MVLFVAKVVLVFVDTVVLVAFTIVVVAVAFAANEVVELLFCIVSGDEDSVIFEDGIVVELLLREAFIKKTIFLLTFVNKDFIPPPNY